MPQLMKWTLLFAVLMMIIQNNHAAKINRDVSINPLEIAQASHLAQPNYGNE